MFKNTLLLVFLVSLVFVGCGGDESEPPPIVMFTEGEEREIGSTLVKAGREDDFAFFQNWIESGGDVNARGLDKRNALHWVRSAKITQYLIEKGADVNAVDQFGETPLYLALLMSAEPLEQGKLLIDAGADVNAKVDGRPFLYSFAGNLQIGEMLINAGADVNANCDDGKTPLAYVLEVLAEEDLNNNENGDEPWRKDWTKYAELLRENGAVE